MRQYRHSPGHVHQFDCPAHINGVARNVCRLPGCEEGIEGFLPVRHHPLGHQRVRDMGTSHRGSSFGRGHDFIDTHGISELRQPSTHLGKPLGPADPDPGELLVQQTVPHVTAVAEKVHRATVVLTGDLDTWQHLDPDSFPCLRGLGDPVEGVVIRQRDHVQTRLERLHHEHRGGVRAITDP